MKNKQTLTKTEFQVMTILWDLGHAACAWDILERWEQPKPAYTTVATYLKVLREKGFVDYFKGHPLHLALNKSRCQSRVFGN
ncbi:MAG: BlaI/MecI/CopY family transcriptional regulator [Bacteroidaceae bacterium]|nr:BlaI/MecI/CopY family transcriptional regulator [Bacteroidaceae bacterium]